MDADGYPEPKELAKIRYWGAKGNLDFKGLMEYCMALWHFPSWATVKGTRYRFATAGWSGNESIIQALQENTLFWMYCWVSSHRGGLYKFHVPRVKKVKP